MAEAQEIAKSSCGALKAAEPVCNENTKSWWLDLAIEQAGCAPACVVHTDTKVAEINWRCTGLIEPRADKEEICIDSCGDGVCDEIVCQAAGCPCAETYESCPDDCSVTERVGDDRDEHGCIGSAGYSWCESKQKCLRSWEEDCPGQEPVR